MKIRTIFLHAAAALLCAGPINAQSDDVEQQRALEAQEAEYSQRLRDAEERMERAARQIAEISRERLPRVMAFTRRFEGSNKPRIGIAIDGSEKSGAVSGVEIEGVTPESAADDAGLRAGDVITAVNGESMSAQSGNEADRLLLDFMQGVEEGDELKIEYLRNDNAGSVDVSPRVMQTHSFSWAPDGQHFQIEDIPGVPQFVKEFTFERGFPWVGSAWSSMELVELNAGLGKYFGTDSGLLVVSAPEMGSLELQDGDVIQSIDGREPKDVRHAMRILSSYQSGESLKLGIMRDKKKRTLKVEIPADFHGSMTAPPPASPVRASLPAMPPADDIFT